MPRESGGTKPARPHPSPDSTSAPQAQPLPCDVSASLHPMPYTHTSCCETNSTPKFINVVLASGGEPWQPALHRSNRPLPTLSLA
eukprot:11575537-Karenia_brevis.AAC.1